MVLNLETLTEELLTRIVSFVAPHSSLWSLVLVSRTLNRLATPYLYKTVDFKGAYSENGIQFLIPFTFLAFQKPNIASFVRSLSIRDCYGTLKDDLYRLEGNGGQTKKDKRQDDNAQDDNNEQSEEEKSHDDETKPSEECDTPADNDEKSEDNDTKTDRITESSLRKTRKGWPDHPERDQIISSAIQGIGYTDEEANEWLTSLLAGDDESAILSILLPHLKQLRCLDISHWWITDDRLVSTFQTASKRGHPFHEGINFSSLTDILVAGYDDKYPVSPTMLGACLGLPALRRLHGLKMGQNEQSEPTRTLTEIPKRSSPIEEIEFRESKLYSEDLKLLLSIPKALKTFIYDLGHNWAWYPVDVNDIRDGLSSHAGSLENLVLDHPDFVEEGEDDNFEPMMFFAFTRLEYLKISGLFLGGFDGRNTCFLENTFPWSLKTLHVTYCWEVGHCQFVTRALRQLLELHEVKFPHLELLILEGEFNARPEVLDMVKDIMCCLSETGIEMRVVDDAYRRTWSGELEKGWGIDETIDWQPTLARAIGEKEYLEIEVDSNSDSHLEFA